MKVLLTGSTGFLGKYVAQQLAKQKYKFICLVRKTSNPNQVEYLSSLGAEIVYGDILEPAALEKPIKRVDAIIHLVGIIHDKQQDFIEVHVNGTQNLVNVVNESRISISTNVTNNKKSALKKSISVSKFKFIYVSALGVNNIPEKNETKYFKTKYLAEEIVRDAGLNYGLTYTIFRPSIIAGREDKSINTFADVIKKFPIIGVPAVKGKLQPIYVEDLAYCIVNSLKDKKSDEKNKNKKTTAKKGTAQNTNKNESDNQIIEIAGPEQFTLLQIFKTVASVLGKKRLFFKVPLFLMFPVARVIEKFSKNPLITPDQLEMLQLDNVCEQKVAEVMFKRKFIGLEDALKEYLP